MNKNKSSTVRMTALASGVCVALLPLAQAQTAPETAVLLNAGTATSTPASKSATVPAKTASPGKAGTMAGHVSAPVCSGEFSATANVSLPEGKSGLLDLQKLQLPTPAWLRTIGDPEVIQVEPTLSPTPRAMFFLFGKAIGTTNLMFQNKEGRCAMVEVSVGVDTAAVQSKLSLLLPEEKNIKVSAVADSLVLSGTVTDAMAADRAVAIARAYVRKEWRKVAGSGTKTPGGGGGGGGASTSAGAAGMDDRIVNMLSIAAPQQVMLEVKVAEVSKSLLDKLGVGITARSSSGSWAYTLLSNFLTGSAGGLLDAKKTNGSQVTLDAEKGDGLVRLLAEPNVMAISGQEGSFLAGGRIFIPVPDDNGRIRLEEKEFGVGLKFTPTVLAGGRINIKVSPEVSELSPAGASFTSANGNVTNILPLITTRRAATTVQLNDGQSFAIGGLIKNNSTANIKGLPVLGEIPVLGALFRSTAFQQDKSELLFVITPRLVQPLPPDYALPTDGMLNPSRSDLFLMGKMEGKPAEAPAQTGQPALPPPAKADADKARPSGPSGFEMK